MGDRKIIPPLFLLLTYLLQVSSITWSDNDPYISGYLTYPRSKSTTTSFPQGGISTYPNLYALGFGINPTVPASQSHQVWFMTISEVLAPTTIEALTTLYIIPPSSYPVLDIGNFNASTPEVSLVALTVSPKQFYLFYFVPQQQENVTGMLNFALQYNSGWSLYYQASELSIWSMGNWLVYQNYSGSMWGSVLVFGGWNGTQFLNSLYEMQLGVGTENPVQMGPLTQIPFESTTLPDPRAYHRTLFNNNNGDLWLFGGKNETDFFNDIWKININYFNWIRVNPNGVSPAPRAGHSMTFPLKDQDTYGYEVFYIFGGETYDNTILNDLWMFNLTSQNWTQLVNNQPARVPRAYHTDSTFYSTSTNSSYLFFVGGISGKGGDISSFSILNLDVDCYYCTVTPFQSSSVVLKSPECMTYLGCVERFIESANIPLGSAQLQWNEPCGGCDPTSIDRFMCNLQCNNKTSNCIPAVPCTNQYTCWNGLCADGPNDCLNIFACDINQKRCRDGSCSSPTNPHCIADVVCSGNNSLCSDGTCQPVCTPSWGCVPGANPVLCADGTCSTSVSACNSDCPYNMTHCVTGCEKSCLYPTWMTPLSYPIIYEDNNQNVVRVGLSAIPFAGSVETPLGFIQYDDSSKNNQLLNCEIILSDAPSSDVMAVGPLPAWDYAFRGHYFFMTFYLQIINPYQDILDIFWEVDSGRDLSTTDYCLAIAVPWYWDLSDVTSTTKNVSYINKFRELAPNWLGPGYELPPAVSHIQTPALRWECILNVTKTTVTIGGGQVDCLLLQSQSTGAFFAVVENGVIQPVPSSGNPLANYVMMGVAAGFFVILSMIVAYKAVQKK